MCDRGIFNLCLIPGNIAGHFILKDPSTNQTSPSGQPVTTTAAPNPMHHMVSGWTGANSELFMVLAICGAAGCAVFLLLRPADHKYGSEPPIETRPALAQIMATVRLTFSPQMICLIPIFTFTGVGMTMWASWFSRQMYSQKAALVMPLLGVAEFVGGMTIGRFVDSFGRSPGLAIGATAGAGALLLTYVGNSNMVHYCGHKHAPCKEFDDYTPFYVAALLYGFMDCCFQSVSAAICAKSFNSTGNSADAWALFRSFQAFGAAFCFFITSTLSGSDGKTASETQLLVEIAITAVVMYLALLGHWLFCKYTTATPISTDLAAAPVGGNYSQAVVINGMVYTAGCIGCRAGADFDPNTSITEQTKIALENLEQILLASGSSLAGVTKVTVFLSDIADMAAMNAVYRPIFVDNTAVTPARSALEVAKLPLGAKVEIEAVAALA